MVPSTPVFKPTKIDEETINNLVKANPQMTDIVVNDGKVFSKNSAAQLDFGGYAKGYALDSALVYLQKQGVKNALINIGGNIIGRGKHGEKPWRVGIQHPRKPNAIAVVNLESGWAIGTSGDYQRYYRPCDWLSNSRHTSGNCANSTKKKCRRVI
jgi:FAD:protein FMN transferase